MTKLTQNIVLSVEAQWQESCRSTYLMFFEIPSRTWNNWPRNI